MDSSLEPLSDVSEVFDSSFGTKNDFWQVRCCSELLDGEAASPSAFDIAKGLCGAIVGSGGTAVKSGSK